MKKLVSIVLSLTLLVSLFTCVNFSAFANYSKVSEDTITAGSAKTVTIDDEGDYYVFSFTPDSDGIYTFRSQLTDGDPIMYLYSDYNYDNDAYIIRADDYDEEYDFYGSAMLEANHTYYIKCASYGNSASYTITVANTGITSFSFTPAEPYVYEELIDICSNGEVTLKCDICDDEITVQFADHINEVGYEPLDVVTDGIINAKDFAYLNKAFN